MTGISFNKSATGDSGGATAATQVVTVPAGVLTGDVMFLCVSAFDTAAGATLTLSSTGTAFTQIGTTQVAFGGGLHENGAIYYAIAGPSDPGATITSGLSTATAFWNNALVTYSGANTGTPVDVSGGTQMFGAAGLAIDAPAETTVSAGDWALYFFPVAPAGTCSLPAGQTTRVNHTSAAGILTVIVDSNASVGAAGTPIGGSGVALTNTAGSGSNWLTAFTVGLAPPVVVTAGNQLQSGRSMLRKRLMYADV